MLEKKKIIAAVSSSATTSNGLAFKKELIENVSDTTTNAAVSSLAATTNGLIKNKESIETVAGRTTIDSIAMGIDSIAIGTIPSSKLPTEQPNTPEQCSSQTPIKTSSQDNTSASTETSTTPLESTSSPSSSSSQPNIQPSDISFIEYENELQMPDIMRVIQKDLSEPYSIYTYRYFIHNWPKLCFLAMHGDTCIGAIVCKLDIHRQMTKRGYIAMLAVDKDYRKLKVGTTLVQKAIHAMLEYNAGEVVLETEITNIPALRLYENLGFVRDKRLFDYYLNGVDALRLKLWFK